MIRKIIHINEDKCNGCGLCASACHEGAIGMLGGKAKLLREDYCDGLGNCLPVCPTGAITFEEREAEAFNEAAVKQSKEALPMPCGCPGTFARTLEHKPKAAVEAQPCAGVQTPSQLKQWPVQIKLAPLKAPYYEDAELLVAADCTAYAYGAFHEDFMRGQVTLIGCPKLDEGDYSEKLTEILRANAIKAVTVVRMEVPCCGGIEKAVKTALSRCGKQIPLRVAVLSTDARVL
ncbi:MAG: 4Fe-4S binding protein [Clostridia bacterium]